MLSPGTRWLKAHRGGVFGGKRLRWMPRACCATKPLLDSTITLDLTSSVTALPKLPDGNTDFRNTVDFTQTRLPWRSGFGTKPTAS